MAAELFCRNCGTYEFFEVPRPPHIALHCNVCGRWVAWKPQNNPIAEMPFGKHKGIPIAELPDDYLDWLLTTYAPLKGNLRRVLEEEFERRGR